MDWLPEGVGTAFWIFGVSLTVSLCCLAVFLYEDYQKAKTRARRQEVTISKARIRAHREERRKRRKGKVKWV